MNKSFYLWWTNPPCQYIYIYIYIYTHWPTYHVVIRLHFARKHSLTLYVTMTRLCHTLPWIWWVKLSVRKMLLIKLGIFSRFPAIQTFWKRCLIVGIYQFFDDISQEMTILLRQCSNMHSLWVVSYINSPRTHLTTIVHLLLGHAWVPKRILLYGENVFVNVPNCRVYINRNLT